MRRSVGALSLEAKINVNACVTARLSITDRCGHVLKVDFHSKSVKALQTPFKVHFSYTFTNANSQCTYVDEVLVRRAFVCLLLNNDRSVIV